MVLRGRWDAKKSGANEEGTSACKSFCRLKFVRKAFAQVSKLADESLAGIRQWQVSVASTVTDWLFRLQP